MKKLFSTLVACSILALSALAHEGHNKTPGAIAAPNGGLIKGTKEHYVELVSAQGQIKIYVYTHDLKAVALDQVKLTGEYALPRKGGKLPLNLVAAKDHFEAAIEAKGSHRFEVSLAVDFKGASEKLKFSVETQE
jgi:hypothetical protein